MHCATHDWVFEELIKIGSTNIEFNGLSEIEFKNVAIENDDLNSELVYTGGGNTVILFRKNIEKDLARQFTKNLTRRVLIKAHGLQLIVTHKDFDWDDSKNNLAKTVSETLADVNKKKYDRRVSTHLMGLGVTADCQYTGLPAVDIRAKSEKDPTNDVWISREVAAKLDFFGAANERLQANFPPAGNRKYVYNFNDFGVKHESSYIAVVHADGNNMGKRVQNFSRKHSKENREYIEAIRKFSLSVEHATKEALMASINQLQESIDDENKIGGVVEIPKNAHGNQFLPFRPIVFGGDDITFVCDGRLGLTLAEVYLRKLTSPELKLSDGDPIFARAGIAIVKTHYPFSRAVALAEDLAKSAKSYIRKNTGEKNLSAMDWHFAVSGPISGLDDIRKREYTVDTGKLYMRPVRLGESVGSDWHSWDTFTSILKEFQESWADKHNKLMSLREALRAGPETVEHFTTTYAQELPIIEKNPDSGTRGWIHDQCTCFDAIEAIDFFVPLERGGK